MGFPNVDVRPPTSIDGEIFGGILFDAENYFLHEVMGWYDNDLTVSQIKPF